MTTQIDVLITDDQANSRHGLKALLQFAPFIRTVWEAPDGETAVRIISELKPEVVLMDVQMPILDGLETTRWIKRTCPCIKVLILTMYPHYKAEALAAGADSFLVKGDSSVSIQDAILDLLPSENTDCGKL